MISPLIFAIVGYIILAGVSILDKFILTKSVKNSATYAFYSTVFFFGIFFLLPFCQKILPSDFIWALVAGLSFGLATWVFFMALKYGETSHMAPFIGASVAIFTYVLSFLILGESLSINQKIGILFLVLASLLFAFEKTKKHSGFHKGFLWGVLSGCLFALSHVSSKYFYNQYSFITGIVWTKGTIGFVSLIALLLPSVRSDIFVSKAKKIKEKTGKATLVIADKFFGLIGTLSIQYAIAIGSVVIVNALAGIEYAFTVLFVYLLTKFKPKLFSEYFAVGELKVEIVAILLAVVGMVFLR